MTDPRHMLLIAVSGLILMMVIVVLFVGLLITPPRSGKWRDKNGSRRNP